MHCRLTSSVQKLEYNRENARIDVAISHLRNKRAHCSLCDELVAARQKITSLNGQVVKPVTGLKNRTRSLNVAAIFAV